MTSRFGTRLKKLDYIMLIDQQVIHLDQSNTRILVESKSHDG